MTDEILTLMDVASLLNVAEKTVYRLAQRSEQPGFKVGGQWRFRRQDLEEWIETKRTSSTQRALAVAPGLGKTRSVRSDERKNRARQLPAGFSASFLRICLFNDCELNEHQYQLRRAGQSVRLEPEVFEVLLYLLHHRDRFVSRDELFKQLWPGQVVSEAALTRCIAEARKAVGDDGVQQQVIRTQYGRGYRFIAVVQERIDVSGSTIAATSREQQFLVQSFTSPTAVLLGKPSIAVLPFVNLSHDPEQEYFSDGLTEDLLTALSKLSGLMVIARNSVFLYKGKVIRPEHVSQELGVRYVLSGSVQKDGNQVRITAQLVDGTTDYQLWAERYDRPFQNVFALQDELTQRIVSALKVTLTWEETTWSRYAPTPRLEAYDHYLRGMEHFHRFTRETNAQARQLFEHAITLDPAYAAAYVATGATHWLDWTWLWSQDPHSLEQALSLVQRALVLDDTLPKAHAQLGSILLMYHQHQQAAAAAQRAIALDPNSAVSYATLAEILTFAGQSEEAIVLAGKAMQLDPAYAASYSALVGHACRLLRRYEEAIAALKRALSWTLSIGGTLKTERQVCKLALTLLPKEVGYARDSCHSDRGDCKIRAVVFQARVGARAGVGGGRLARPWKRTVTAALRVMGLSQEGQFQKYPRVLNRAQWSSLAVARVLVGVVVRTFASAGTVVIGIDDTLERRRGEKIKAKGIYRDPVRSSRSHMVKASGLRWLCAMLLSEISWAGRVWALPVLTALCPSERYHQQRGQRHKPLPQWAGQLIGLLHRWLPGREVVVVADSSYAVIELLKQVSDTPDVSLITRLRLDAALYDPAPVRAPRQHGRPRKKGARRPTLQHLLKDALTPWTPLTVSKGYGGGTRDVEICTDTAVWYHTGLPPVGLRWVLIRDPQEEFEPQALLSTHLAHQPAQILEWFVRRWTREVTFEEARAHLGIETQRQWNDLAIGRTTPALFGLYSLVLRFTNDVQVMPPQRGR